MTPAIDRDRLDDRLIHRHAERASYARFATEAHNKARTIVTQLAPSVPEPLISAVICTYNRAPLLRQALGALCAQTIGLDRFEVIVVDDGSTDDTREVAERFSGVLHLRYAYQANSGLASGKNHGLFLSRAPIVAFLDDDDVLDPHCLEEHHKTHERFAQPSYAVLGYTGLAEEPARSPLMRYVTDVGCQLFSYPHIKHESILDFSYFWGGRSSCKRGFLLEYGVFNPVFRFGAEDIELGFRLEKVGLRVVYNAAAISSMVRSLSFEDFCRRCRLQGQSNWAFSQLHPDPSVQAWAQIDHAELEWAQIAPRFDDLMKAAGNLDRFAQARARMDLHIDPITTELLHQFYAAAFRANRIQGTIERKLGTLAAQPTALRETPSKDAHGRRSASPILSITHCASLDEYRAFASTADHSDTKPSALEAGIIDSGKATEIEGFCHVCDKTVRFKVDFAHAYLLDGKLTPNWRETVTCPGCGLNNRMRGAINVFEQECRPGPQADIYITEQATGFHALLRKRYPRVIGSEFLGSDRRSGSVDDRGIRNEDVTRLSFADASFDYVLSFDVLEHVPDYRAALAEFHRVLRSGGRLLLSVPFRPNAPETLIRARILEDGSIEHLTEPEYHGDPLRPDGCLAFYHFGWDLIDAIRGAGFSNPSSAFFGSFELGHLGSAQMLFMGRKEEEPFIAAARR
ncbi:Methyltransferase domain-containing protein [Thiocapsa roseopersicina]|uniref:Methyltransferase domain-containing protein n=1 Tax=Thiocapsa roseopersicina TaxID=1058 RepID=A0A1H2V1U3_THIRO|nr:Methyltransferase domain-containing protein [Thiocapsa roseopersicina]